MKKVLLTAIVTFLLSAAPAFAIINPHYGDESCGSCHLEDPETGTDGVVDYNFLARDIDPTCLICHEQNCCTIAKPHQSTHPSGIRSWDEKVYGEPDELPLSSGMITCATCHFWRRSNNPEAEDYKLLRLVDISPTGVDWTVLCADCHKNY